jgi:hypothetical protein
MKVVETAITTHGEGGREMHINLYLRSIRRLARPGLVWGGDDVKIDLKWDHDINWI